MNMTHSSHKDWEQRPGFKTNGGKIGRNGKRHIRPALRGRGSINAVQHQKNGVIKFIYNYYIYLTH